ncbi:hypothetical protein ACWGID_07275 [Kribbella sp. NPDC054772]
MLDSIERIAADPDLTVRDRDERITALLAPHGPGVAADCLEGTEDRAIAEYVAAYLERIPGAAEEKLRAARRLLSVPELAPAAARLVPWLPADVLDGIIRNHHAELGARTPYSSVLFAIATYFPERLRSFADGIDNPFIAQATLSGAADDVADALLDRWKNERDLDHLWKLALIRTEHAADLIASVRDDVDNPEDWEWLMPLAGRMPDSDRPSGIRPAYLGFLADKGVGSHVVGGAFPGDVPLCADCGTPAARVLTLSAADLPYELSRDPSFFWFTCECDEVDVIVVRLSDEGTKVFFNPQGPSVPSAERSMVLAVHPNQTGVTMPAVPTADHHQIGGLPRWQTPETHPICPDCGRFMPFLAATTVGRERVLVFGFWCDPCGLSTTRLQG